MKLALSVVSSYLLFRLFPDLVPDLAINLVPNLRINLAPNLTMKLIPDLDPTPTLTINLVPDLAPNSPQNLLSKQLSHFRLSLLWPSLQRHRPCKVLPTFVTGGIVKPQSFKTILYPFPSQTCFLGPCLPARLFLDLVVNLRNE